MGTDIHAFVEVSYSTQPETWHCFVKDIDIVRDDDLFDLLVGIRNKDTALCDRRGFPKDASLVLIEAYTLKIDNSGCIGTVLPQDAEAFVQDFKSRYFDKEKNRITNPHWYYPSWLYTDELEAVSEKYTHWNIKSIVAMMRVINQSKKSRFVFWFDS